MCSLSVCSYFSCYCWYSTTHVTVKLYSLSVLTQDPWSAQSIFVWNSSLFFLTIIRWAHLSHLSGSAVGARSLAKILVFCFERKKRTSWSSCFHKRSRWRYPAASNAKTLDSGRQQHQLFFAGMYGILKKTKKWFGSLFLIEVEKENFPIFPRLR